MRKRTVRKGHRHTFFEQLESRQLMSVTYGVNAISNPGAESFSGGTADGNTLVTPTGWSVNNGGTVAPYSFIGTASQVPPNKGTYLFAGGPNTDESDFFQTINLSNVAADVDAGKVTFNLSAYLGGFTSQGDNAQVFVNFQDSSHFLVDQSFINGPTAAERGNNTALLLKSTGNVAVPKTTRFAQVQIHNTRTDGSYNDAYADNLSLVFTGPQMGDPASVTLQAEAATLAGGTVASTANSGFTGNGYADFGGQNSSVQFSVKRVNAGPANLVFRYANGGTANRPLSVAINGTVVTTLPFAPTGSWTTWKTILLPAANLVAGTNTIKLVATTSVGGANLDALNVNTVRVLQAENATLAGGTVVAHANAGYTGTGYADFGSTNSSATFSNVQANAAGAVTLVLRYANGSTANRPLKLQVNGGAAVTVNFNPTGSWTTWGYVTVTVNLNAGANSIKLSVANTDGPNLDWLGLAS